MARIVVVDDEESIRRAICMVLAIHNHKAIPAADGRTGLQLCLKENPDVVITDIMMPGLTGLQLIRKLRETSPDLLIVVVTGYMASTASELKREGVDHIFGKPFSLVGLLETVENLLASREAARSGSEI